MKNKSIKYIGERLRTLKSLYSEFLEKFEGNNTEYGKIKSAYYRGKIEVIDSIMKDIESPPDFVIPLYKNDLQFLCKNEGLELEDNQFESLLEKLDEKGDHLHSALNRVIFESAKEVTFDEDTRH